MSWFKRKSSSPHYRSDSTETKMEEGKLIIYPRALHITWGNDRRYWELRSTPKGESVAELKQVCWLEVTGSTPENLKIGNTYKVGFNVSLRADAFGWDECNVYIMAKIGRMGNYSFKKVCLSEEPSTGERFIIPKYEDLKIKVDPSPNDNDTNNPDDLKLYFGMYEVWSNKWKGGLNIHSAFVEEV